MPVGDLELDLAVAAVFMRLPLRCGDFGLREQRD